MPASRTLPFITARAVVLVVAHAVVPAGANAWLGFFAGTGVAACGCEVSGT